MIDASKLARKKGLPSRLLWASATLSLYPPAVLSVIPGSQIRTSGSTGTVNGFDGVPCAQTVLKLLQAATSTWVHGECTHRRLDKSRRMRSWNWFGCYPLIR